MSWVLPLVGCGGPAVSRCGHETRRHRVYGALFASVFASVLLAACGGGSGGNLTTSSEPEPGPPGPGPLTATGSGGNESEEEQQQKIIVNQEEEQQQEIVVNIQPEPEEESEEEEEESEEEEQQQQLTIIEEVVPEYRKPEKPKPTYSAQQQSQPESEEESEEEGEESEEEEEQQQQLTIIEEEVIEFRPPEKPKPTYSKQVGTQQGVQQAVPTEHHNVGAIISGSFDLSYSIWMTNDPTKNDMSFLRFNGNTGDTGRLYNFNDLSDDRTFNIPGLADAQAEGLEITATYSKSGGFRGNYHYNGEFGNIVGDVNLRVKFDAGEDTEITGTLANNLSMGGYNFGNLGIGTLELDEDSGIGKGTLSLGTTTITTNSLEAVLSNRWDSLGRLYESGGSTAGQHVAVNSAGKLVYSNQKDTPTGIPGKPIPRGQAITSNFVDMRGRTSIVNTLGERVYDIEGNPTTFYEVDEDNLILVLDSENLSSIPHDKLKDYIDGGRKLVTTDNGCDCATRYSSSWDKDFQTLLINRKKLIRVHLPNRIAGEVKATGFKHSGDTESTASKNALYGVFIGEVYGKKP